MCKGVPAQLRKMCLEVDSRHDGGTRVSRGVLIGSPTNRSASCGRVVFPNLGYKKDTFLDPSLVSNNFSSHPNKPTTTIPTLNISDFQQWPAATMNSHPTSPLLLLTLFPLGICLALEFLVALLRWTWWDVQLWLVLMGV